MKKWLVSSFVLLALMFIAAGVYAQTQDKDKNKDKAKTECKAFVDQNNDGICDNHGTENCKHSEGCKSKSDCKKDEAKCAGTCKGKEGSKCAQKDACESNKEEAVVAPASSCCGKK